MDEIKNVAEPLAESVRKSFYCECPAFETRKDALVLLVKT
jgi:hypothetical protein